MPMYSLFNLIQKNDYYSVSCVNLLLLLNKQLWPSLIPNDIARPKGIIKLCKFICHEFLEFTAS